MKQCPQCGGQSSDRSRYCYHCGASLAEPAQKGATVPQGPLVAASPPPGPAPVPQPQPAPAPEPGRAPAGGDRPVTTVDDPALGAAPAAEALDGPSGLPGAAAPALPPGPEQAERLAAEARAAAIAAPGTVVDGKYVIERVLGEGGMGVVYLARERHTGVEVVLKAVKAEIAHRAEIRQRTLAEGRALARIDHANVVQLKAVVSEPEQLWLVMQYIDGESLEQAIARNNRAGTPMPLDEALRIFRQVAAGVAAAHREGLIHRDLKPGNILLRPKDGGVKVTDFGIAKVEQDALAGRGVTRGFVGSPYYTSPEQVTGQRDLDRRVDVYALGILLYEMLTGQVPFDSESTFEIMRMHTDTPLPPVTAVRGDLPRAIDDVLGRACAKDRTARYGSCEELLAALEAAAAPPSPPAGTYADPSGGQPALASRPLGTVSAVATALPLAAAPTPRRSRAPLYVLGVLVLLLGTVGGLVAAGLIALPGGSRTDAATASASASAPPPPPPSASTASAPPPPPLASLAGRWVSDSNRELEAVFVGELLEFRVVDPKQFAPQDYRAGEPRFVLHPLAGAVDRFAVEDRIRPLPPAGYRYDSAKARTTCYAVWKEADGAPLAASYDGSQLSVDFAKIEPDHPNFVEVGRTVISCRGLEKLSATRVPAVLRRR